MINPTTSFAPAIRQVVFWTLLIFVAVLVPGGFYFNGESFWLLSAWVGVSLAIASLFAVWIARRAVAPFDDIVGALSDAMTRVGKGERAVVMPIRSADTHPVLVPLVTDFNAMVQAVQTTLGATRNELAHQRALDPLTGVANRAALEECIQQLMNTATASGHGAVLAYIDVDKFKLINEAQDTLGGDELLRLLAERVQQLVDPRAMFGRVASDEFAVAFQERSLESALATCEAIRNTVRAVPFDTHGRPTTLTVSIGVVPITDSMLRMIAGTNQRQVTAADLLAAGAAACQTAKEMGASRVYAVRDQASAERTRFTTGSWLKRIHAALDQGQFRLVYQPIRPLVERPVPHPRFEVLIRILESDGRFGMPGHFISVAERYDLMQALDRWVLHRAIIEWKQAEQLGLQPTFSVNLSGHSLSSDTFMQFLEGSVLASGIPPPCLCFELTETAAISNPERAREVIERLRARGNKFWLDDFGAGLSSFNYIKQFPVDGIKIDGMFVRGITKTYLDYALTEAITRVAKALGLGTVAEYVENEDIAKKLRQLGIEYGQGYWIGKPLPFEETFRQMLQTQRMTPVR
jgi:diguanylate cyclase (GGDEF)-like protein